MRADGCPTCQSTENHNVTQLGQANPHFLCRNGHVWQEVAFRRHRYQPPLNYGDVTGMAPVAVEIDVTETMPVRDPWPVRSIFCGPPADQPNPPTPAEMLEQVGLAAYARL